jgi:hypothetical protein
MERLRGWLAQKGYEETACVLQRRFQRDHQIREHLESLREDRSGVQCRFQPDSGDEAVQYIANGLFARANQSLVVMLIKRRKFNRDLFQG